MSSEWEENNDESVPDQSETVTEETSELVMGAVRSAEEAFNESQLFSLVSACSNPGLLLELLSEVGYLHLRPDEYPVFLEHVAAFHRRMEAGKIPASVLCDFAKFPGRVAVIFSSFC